MKTYKFLHMSIIISFLGIPGSGKSTLGKKLAKKLKIPFMEEVGTQVILESGYTSAGFKLPYEFDERVFERNKERLEKTKKLLERTPVIWESHFVTDTSYLLGRAFFGDNNPKRFKLFQKYQDPYFSSLNDRTVFVILDMDPEESLRRQRERNMPQLVTPDIKLLRYVRESFLKFYKQNKKRCIRIKDVDKKSEEEVLREIEEGLKPFLEELENRKNN